MGKLLLELMTTSCTQQKKRELTPERMVNSQAGVWDQAEDPWGWGCLQEGDDEGGEAESPMHKGTD
jgi:hypothetical protein